MRARFGFFLCIIIAATLLLAQTDSSSKTSFEPTDVKIGIRPLYGLVFGEFSGNYNDAPGGIIYGRGLYELNIDGKLMLYPEFSWGVLYLGNKSEKSRELFLFPFALNIYFDAPMLNFKTKAGVFALRPYIGLGAYLDHYKSSGAEATGFDFGYQAGVNLEYRHENMKNCYVEVSIDHLFTTNFKQYIPMLAFSAGVGCSIEYRGPATAAEKTAGDKVESLREK